MPLGDTPIYKTKIPFKIEWDFNIFYSISFHINLFDQLVAQTGLEPASMSWSQTRRGTNSPTALFLRFFYSISKEYFRLKGYFVSRRQESNLLTDASNTSVLKALVTSRYLRVPYSNGKSLTTHLAVLMGIEPTIRISPTS